MYVVVLTETTDSIRCVKKLQHYVSCSYGSCLWRAVETYDVADLLSPFLNHLVFRQIETHIFISSCCCFGILLKTNLFSTSVVTILLFYFWSILIRFLKKIATSIVMSIFSWPTFINYWSLHNSTIPEALSSFVNKYGSCDNVGKIMACNH